MQVQYLRKATTDLSAGCEPGVMTEDVNGDVPLIADVYGVAGELVAAAVITMYMYIM